MNSEPGEYKSDKTNGSIPSVISNPWSFSVSWADMPNMQGVKPPNPQFKPSLNIPYILPPVMVSSPNEQGNMPNGLIQSKREPYAVEWYPGIYGSLNSRIGTNMGSNYTNPGT